MTILRHILVDWDDLGCRSLALALFSQRSMVTVPRPVAGTFKG